VTLNVPEVLLDVKKPVIGAVNGVCVTGGLELALACDFLIASDRARFADTHVQLGVLPSWGGTALLPEAVGIRRAKELALSGRFFSAEEAERYGLVGAVVPHERLIENALAIAQMIAEAPTAAATALLSLYDRGEGDVRPVRLELERELAIKFQEHARQALTDYYRGDK
jgi:enoyl-CoA hydratase